MMDLSFNLYLNDEVPNSLNDVGAFKKSRGVIGLRSYQADDNVRKMNLCFLAKEWEFCGLSRYYILYSYHAVLKIFTLIKISVLF